VGKKDNLGYFAAGASDGTVIVWDLARGVVAKVLGEANEGPVPTAVVFSNDAKTILVASSQPHVTQYNLVSGEVVETFKGGKKGALKIAMNPKVDVFAVGGCVSCLVDLTFIGSYVYLFPLISFLL
jgi:WD40 repeat protein